MRPQLTEQINDLGENLIQHYSQLAWQAMLAEVNLTPKPGLVDKYNTGAHKDMALTDFHLSANAIAQYFPQFILAGAQYKHLAIEQVLPEIRSIGIACEKAMFRATQGVNTHKGSIFSLGLVLTVIGRQLALRQKISPMAISRLVAEMCQGINDELKRPTDNLTAGQRLYQQYGLTGARGEAESGYHLVINHSLPYYLQQLAIGKIQDIALIDTLILLMKINDDTNIANRGGMQGLVWTKQQATLLLQSGINHPSDLVKVQIFDQQCIERNLSPGGSADLLILTWFFARLPYSNMNT
ncbi:MULTISPECIES: triphosphoribosyl-dephospho-CoA synthase CitG [Providencia]|uniref:Probable 2-(5''-triphosphoribosyl)-3'-dephosphocoenzyme-A synthase n=1 Tax=Providencia heimbachae ATCC 35613 TaxID=1354272 RepID=A0A1B7K161_9GAMM|nr:MULTISPECIES: triphosphoribosyl-dephospho-CoA synthase CitG [Providencia]MBP6123308.1 triphosphoribosyl-dephospho-CoA synthase CitG [Providencia sp.]MDD9340169.1 triphosphoribosyl-dephospho-CoA synthase CitG [Providencia heimbachae]NIH23133.1 triphosphoribosyl-dephospho-CoA synthase CitG [Providencia heimbachae]OAT53878.1 2-(5''-triphosphoribosyl)-3'-dephosphocoenzyme-A synthase [Providencia heimbachae ATCC 35613]QCJ70642.1 triphosphoribosyl-dephospho-CoA synthase CitG [Providencia heimbach